MSKAESFVGRKVAVYEISDFIGEGGFAYVYRAKDENLDIDVALKVLKPSFAHDEIFEQNFRKEAHRAAKFRHPNVVAIHYAGKDDDVVFFSMDLLASGLADLVEEGPQGDDAIIKVGSDVASALQFAHTHEGGLVHRDLKPDNILFDRHGNAVVTDFGIAEAATNYTQATGTTVYVGTPVYMSPEQARGRKVNHLSDIYSLGATLYEVACGETPFEGSDWFELGRKHIEQPPEPPRERGSPISEDVENVILKCLEKDPEDRYQSAAEVEADLKGQAGGMAATVQVPTRKARGKPAKGKASTVVNVARTTPRWIYGLVAAAVLLVFGLTYRFNVAGVQEQVPVLAGLPLVGPGQIYADEVRTTLVNGEPDVEGEIAVLFSGAIDQSTATSENVHLVSRTTGDTVPVRVAASAQGLALLPLDSLAFETEYEVAVAGVQGIDGDPVETRSEEGLLFSTRQAPEDKEPPLVAGRTHDRLAEPVDPGSTLELTFNEPLDPNSVSSESIVLIDSRGRAVAREVLLEVGSSGGGTTVSLNPRGLRRGSRYTIRLDSSIADLAGNHLEPEQIQFRTSGPSPAQRERAAEPERVSLAVVPGGLSSDRLERFTVYVDGQQKGSPPVSLQAEGGRSHEIRITGQPQFTGPDRAVEVYRATVPAGASRQVNLQTDVKGFGTMSVNTQPAAVVLVDGRQVGTTPPGVNVTLVAGEHTLEVRPKEADADAYGTVERTFTVEPFGSKSFGQIELPKK